MRRRTNGWCWMTSMMMPMVVKLKMPQKKRRPQLHLCPRRLTRAPSAMSRTSRGTAAASSSRAAPTSSAPPSRPRGSRRGCAPCRRSCTTTRTGRRPDTAAGGRTVRRTAWLRPDAESRRLRPRRPATRIGETKERDTTTTSRPDTSQVGLNRSWPEVDIR